MNPPWRVVLDHYPASVRPNSPVEPLGNSGGLSGARLWRFSSSRGPLLLRRWPSDGPDRARLETIHEWLRQAADLGFVPVPVQALDGRTIVEHEGQFWEVTPWMPGASDLSRPPVLDRVIALFRGLAGFHVQLAGARSERLIRFPENEFVGWAPPTKPLMVGSAHPTQSKTENRMSPGLASRVVEIERLMLGEFESIRTVLARLTSDLSSSLARSWLDRAVALAPDVASLLRKESGRFLPIQPCLRDARPDHFLLEGDRLTGLVDFGAMDRDSVAGDLARLLAEGVGPDRFARSVALKAYESIRPLNESELQSIEAFERANALLGPARWVRWNYIENRHFEDPAAVVRGLRRGLERLEETFGKVGLSRPSLS